MSGRKAPRIMWGRVIRAGAARQIPGDMHRDLCEAAADWRVCAVGQQLRIWYNDNKFDALSPAVHSVDPKLYAHGTM